MKQFFKYVFASAFGFILGSILLIGLSFVMLAGAVAALESFGSEKEVSVKDNSILRVSFGNSVVDRADKDPFADVDFGPFQGQKTTGLNDVLEAIEKAKDDDKIKGIYMDMASMPAGMATIEEIRNALLDFKTSGKWIIAYGETYSQGAYYVSTVADRIYMYPQGEMDFKGLATKLMFFKNALEKLDVEAQIIRGPNNKYKSAVEPFMYDKMSDANREQLTVLLNSVWGRMTSEISKARGVSVGELMVMADSLSVQSAKSAVDARLIDATRHYDEVVAELMDSVSVEDRDDLEMVSLSDYAKYKPKREEGEEPSYKIKDRVAVIYASGEIRSGSSGDGTLGSETIAKAIREAREDSTVKAIVLRVNSPGGSALASDVIWRETKLAKETKPFVVSMGDLAASGGYYISSYGDRIFAETTTITGSIGVFGMIPNAGKFLKERLGLTFDLVQTNAHADWMTIDRPLDDYEDKVIQQSVIMVYDTFLTRVATGRGMTVKEVDAVGQGRVWTGSDALEVGLVDEIGGLKAAIAYAVEQAELEEYKLKELPEQKDPFEELMKDFSNNAKSAYLKYTLGDFYPMAKEMENVLSYEGVQARIPFYMRIY